MLNKIIFSFYFIVSALSAFCQRNGQNVGNTVIISGSVEGAKPSDVITLQIWDQFLSKWQSHIATPYREYKYPLNKKDFSFSIEGIDGIKYFSLGIDSPRNNGFLKELIYLYMIEPGDSINMKLDLKTVITKIGYGSGFDTSIQVANMIVKGKGWAKYQALFVMNKLQDQIRDAFSFKNTRLPAVTDVESYLKRYAGDIMEINVIANSQIAVLEKYNSLLNPDIVTILKANIIGLSKYDKYNLFTLRYPNITDSIRKRKLLEYFLSQRDDQLGFDRFPDHILASSYYYIQFIVSKLISDNKINFGKGTAQNIYPILRTNYDGLLREKLLAYYFLSPVSLPKQDSLLTDAIPLVKSDYVRSIFEELLSIRKGMPAYRFSLPDKNGNIISMDDLKGKAVFIDFWYTGCMNCAIYYKEVLKKAEQRFKNNNDIVFITISIDADVGQWKKSIKTGIYTSDDLVNLYTDGLGIEHPIMKYYKISGFPSPLLIDSKGKISMIKGKLRTGSIEEVVSEIEKALK